jgi:PAS domain-containing protein
LKIVTEKKKVVLPNLWSARWDKAKLMFCVARDGRKTFEQERIMLKSERRFKALVQEGYDLIGILDAEGNYTYVSPTSTAILGLLRRIYRKECA